MMFYYSLSPLSCDCVLFNPSPSITLSSPFTSATTHSHLVLIDQNTYSPVPPLHLVLGLHLCQHTIPTDPHHIHHLIPSGPHPPHHVPSHLVLTLCHTITTNPHPSRHALLLFTPCPNHFIHWSLPFTTTPSQLVLTLHRTISTGRHLPSHCMVLALPTVPCAQSKWVYIIMHRGVNSSMIGVNAQ